MRLILSSALAVLLTAGASFSTSEPTSLASNRLFSHVGDYPLGDSVNRIDYQSLDPAAHRLYIAKMGAGTLIVFDTRQNKTLAELKGFPKVTGVLAVPELHRLYASVPGAGLVSSLDVGLGMLGLSSGGGAVAVLDPDDLHEIARLPGGVFPDGIAYDPKDHKIFVSDELGSQILVIDAGANRLVARVAMGGEVGNVRYDPITAKVYATIQSRDELAVVDPVKDHLVARFPLPGGNHPHGLALAPGTAVGYVACDGNDRLLTVDLATGRVLDRKPLGHDPDVLAIDANAKRLYVASESGNLSSFDIAVSTAPISLGDVFVGEDAHSVAADSVSNRLYLPLANENGRAVLRVLEPKL